MRVMFVDRRPDIGIEPLLVDLFGALAAAGAAVAPLCAGALPAGAAVGAAGVAQEAARPAIEMNRMMFQIL